MAYPWISVRRGRLHAQRGGSDRLAPDLPEVADAETQVALDLTPVPAGMGAVFVPSATRPELEPQVHVYAGDERVATAAAGRRIPRPPGRYTVITGRGPMQWRPRTELEVEAGRTAITPDFFAALRVLAIDPYDRPIDQAYSLISTDGSRTYGPERTSIDPAYGATRTWIVAPGDYYLVPSNDPDQLEGRVALSIGAGWRIPYRLVMDGERLVRTEFPDRKLLIRDSIWRFDWVIGGSVALDRAKGQLSGFSGDALRIGAFTRLEAGIDVGDHLALFKLGLDQNWVGLEHAFERGLPFQKLTDFATAELMYNYRLGEFVGPYVRANARTSFFDTVIFPEEASNVEVQRPDGTRYSFNVAGGSELQLMSSFGPTILQEGAGLGFTAWDDDTFTLLLRRGVAARRQYYGDGGRYLKSHAPGQILLTQLDDVAHFGVEASVSLRLRLDELIGLQSSFDAFSSFNQIGGDDDFKPVFFWDSSATLRLNRWASLVYQVVVHRDDARLEQLQIRQ